MTDVASRLRAEAQTVPPTADPGLAERVCARLPSARPPVRRYPHVPALLAAAAGLIAMLALAWVALSGEAPPAPLPVAALPTPPTLGEMLGQVHAGLPQAAVADELAALGADLAAVVRTVRGAVPF